MKTKETNIVTVLSLLIIIVTFILFMFFWKTSSAVTDSAVNDSSNQSSTVSVLSNVEDITSRTHKTSSENKSSEVKITGKENTTSTKSPHKSLKNKSLFIGDSRTVGLMEYGGIKNSDFFCWVGMSVYNINKKSVSVPDVGKVSLTELLSGKKYDNIYIMLGINEIGYKLSSIVDKYSDLINSIKEIQPDANIFAMANLHVTEKTARGNDIVNNKAINNLNSNLKNLAQGKGEFYIDANVLFDDKNGNLSAEKSEDGTHIYAKYYKEWGNWIMEQTALLIGE